MKITSYRAARVAAWNRKLDISRDPLGVMLLGDSYTPHVNDDRDPDQIARHEISVGGYEAAPLIGQRLVRRGDFDYLMAEAPEWRFGDVTDVRYAVVFAVGGPPLAVIDFEETLRVPHLRIEWDERGIMSI